MSFLHCTKPEIDLPPETDPYDMSVYEGGRDTLKAFVEKGFLVQDPEPIMYIYQQTMGLHSQKGIMALASVDDYENNRIKKHEFTLAKKEEDRTKLTNIQNANSGPVFLTFRENLAAIKSLIEQVSSRPCYADVTTDDDVRHVLWRSTLEESAQLQEEF